MKVAKYQDVKMCAECPVKKKLYWSSTSCRVGGVPVTQEERSQLVHQLDVQVDVKTDDSQVWMIRGSKIHCQLEARYIRIAISRQAQNELS